MAMSLKILGASSPILPSYPLLSLPIQRYTMKENRIVFVDYLRVVACFLVMLVHASENFYAADASGLAGNVSMLVNEQNRFWVAFYDGTLGRISVPLFMLASAFLLVPLKPGVRMVDFYKRRFKRVLTPMIVFMLLYTFLPLLWGQMTWEQSWTDFTMLPFTFPSMAGHLWFMYPLISLYLIMPVVSPWLERASARDERLFLCISSHASSNSRHPDGLQVCRSSHSVCT